MFKTSTRQLCFLIVLAACALPAIQPHYGIGEWPPTKPCPNFEDWVRATGYDGDPHVLQLDDSLSSVFWVLKPDFRYPPDAMLGRWEANMQVMGVADTSGVVDRMDICDLRVWQSVRALQTPRSSQAPQLRGDAEQLFVQTVRQAMAGARVSPTLISAVPEAKYFRLPLRFEVP